MQTTNLTAEQKKAANQAINKFVVTQARALGMNNKPVILIPEFAMDDNGDWQPVAGVGIRPTKKEHFSFMRLGMAYISVGASGFPEVKVLKTNVFNEDSKLELLVEAYGLTIGAAIPDTTLVVEESLTAFSKSNPNRDIKYAGESKIPCTVDGQPIFRRVKLAPAGKTNTLIQHDNQATISEYAKTAWANLQTANSPRAGINTAARIAELKAIAKAKRTPEQAAELAELLEG